MQAVDIVRGHTDQDCPCNPTVIHEVRSMTRAYEEWEATMPERSLGEQALRRSGFYAGWRAATAWD